MKILLIMDPGIAVPPPEYGGHERLVAMFAEEYTRLGHQVTVLSGPGSSTSGKNYHFGKNDLTRSGFQRLLELIYVWVFLLARHRQFDFIHNFGRLLYLLPIIHSKAKKVMTYGRTVTPRGIRLINKLHPRNLIFTAPSQSCVNSGNVAGRWEVVYNAIDFQNYGLVESVSQNSPLMYLGRLDKIKGVHIAIQVALKSQDVLWIGGNIPHTPDNLEFYKKHIEPYFDNEKIIYLGALNDEQKNHYLGQAGALLFPIDIEEAFGMVMIEAMACGTPVIGFKRGAVEEVITEGVTGYSVNTADQVLEKIPFARLLDRRACREEAERRFDVRVVAKYYLRLFNPYGQ